MITEVIRQKQCRVILADDHPLILFGVKSALTRVEGVSVIGECCDGDITLQLCLELKPDLLILDVNMPGLRSDLVVQEARAHQPNLKILVLSAFDDDFYIRRFSRLEIHGYMLKDEAPESLAQAVRVIEQGAVWFSHTIASRLLTLKHPAKVLFTPREDLILSLLLKGHDNKEIAEKLCLAKQTIRNLISNIYQKTGVKNRIQASVWAKDNLWQSNPSEVDR